MKSVLGDAFELLKSDNEIVLATILEQHGSTPRTSGTQFVIKTDGTSIGTIGGGQVEADVIEAAAWVFTNRSSLFLSYEKSEQKMLPASELKNGKLSILLELVESSKKNIALYEALDQALKNRTGVILTLNIKITGEDGTCRITPTLFSDDLNWLAGASLSQNIIDDLFTTTDYKFKPVFRTSDDITYWLQAISPPSRLTLFGAGHVSRATARLAVSTEFQTMVIDDRKDLLSIEYYDSSVNLKHLDSLEEVPQDLQFDEYDYIVIMTRSHTIDRKILGQVLRTKAKYVGMLGSRRKREAAFKKLTSLGYTQAELERVHSPIGIKIGAETPEEIAVSILAELIQLRSGHGPEEV